MKKTGFYIIKDNFFTDMPDPYLKGNKAGNRPHYYCFEDSDTGIFWMIPLSSRIDKYKKIVENKEKAGKPCDIIHIVKLDDSRESAFLIQINNRKSKLVLRVYQSCNTSLCNTGLSYLETFSHSLNRSIL